MVENLTRRIQQSIYAASGGRSQAKAVYRLLANEKFETDKVQGGIKDACIEQMKNYDTVLLVQDTTEIDLNGHKKTEGLGYCDQHNRGILLHSCVAIGLDGVPIGIVTQIAETRETAANETLTASEKVKRPIEEKESFRWLETMREAAASVPDGVHGIIVADRECDFYEFYDDAQRIACDFVIRVVTNRVTQGGEKLKQVFANTKPCGKMRVEVPRDSRKGIKARVAELTVRYTTISINRPAIRKEEHIAKQVSMNVVQITEENPPAGVEAISWILATSLPVTGFDSAVKVVEIYVKRWGIERFHYVLKSGCKVEAIQQRHYERIKVLLFLYSAIAIFIMQMTLLNRAQPELPCGIFFEEEEWKILYCAANRTKTPPAEPYPLENAVRYLSILGGRKNAPSDGAAGMSAIWQGLSVLFILTAYAPFVGQV
jgi:hypothetical protein